CASKQRTPCAPTRAACTVPRGKAMRSPARVSISCCVCGRIHVMLPDSTYKILSYECVCARYSSKGAFDHVSPRKFSARIFCWMLCSVGARASCQRVMASSIQNNSTHRKQPEWNQESFLIVADVVAVCVALQFDVFVVVGKHIAKDLIIGRVLQKNA